MLRQNRKPVDDIYKELKIVRFSDMIRIELCKFGARISNNLLPDPIQEQMVKRGGKKTHQYETRNKHIPNTQKHGTTRFNNSFMCRGITKYSKLTQELKSIKSMPLFVKKLRDIIISTY